MRFTDCRHALVGLVSLAFMAACGDTTEPDPAIPTAGRVRVTAATSGPDPDGDGYVVTLDSGVRYALESNGSITFWGVPAGTREVRLDSVATNCAADHGTNRQVSVPAGQLTTVDFAITCVARVGTIAVSIATTGIDLPAGGYLLEVDGAGRPVGANDTVILIGLREGPHDIWLRDFAPNCTDPGPARQVSVTFRDTATVAFTVTCVARGDRTGPFIEVSAGANHTCAGTATGSLYCWGYNSEGQLGDGTTATRLTPTLVRSDGSFVQVSAGAGYTCARTAVGTTYCWGDNSFGQLGDGTTVSRLVPGLVSGTTSFTEVSAGRDNDIEYTGDGHTCARTATGAVYCWGDNGSGQLGNGTRTDQLVPTAVAGDLRFARISAGGGHTCGITDPGAAYCWGYNGTGQLGGATGQVAVPSPVSADVTFTEVKASLSHSCGRTTSGAIYCWGYNGTGQLGNGFSTGPYNFAIFSAPAPVVGNHSFTTVTVGYHHTCGLASDGAAYCWGHEGLLGDGTRTQRLVPTLVRGNLQFVEISAGWFHTCARTVEGVIYCWGAGGALGDGTTTFRLEPTRVR